MNAQVKLVLPLLAAVAIFALLLGLGSRQSRSVTERSTSTVKPVPVEPAQRNPPYQRPKVLPIASRDQAIAHGNPVWLGASFAGGEARLDRRLGTRSGLLYTDAQSNLKAALAPPQYLTRPADAQTLRPAFGKVWLSRGQAFIPLGNGLVSVLTIGKGQDLRAALGQLERLPATIKVPRPPGGRIQPPPPGRQVAGKR